MSTTTELPPTKGPVVDATYRKRTAQLFLACKIICFTMLGATLLGAFTFVYAPKHVHVSDQAAYTFIGVSLVVMIIFLIMDNRLRKRKQAEYMDMCSQARYGYDEICSKVAEQQEIPVRRIQLAPAVLDTTVFVTPDGRQVIVQLGDTHITAWTKSEALQSLVAYFEPQILRAAPYDNILKYEMDPDT
ncbi:MAG TPA: hypothetical protein VLF67_00795 [Candidatus Saccharimonas sp.]|nr:hypothetical protein [Candidatus Saccharimonas sp.]